MFCCVLPVWTCTCYHQTFWVFWFLDRNWFSYKHFIEEFSSIFSMTCMLTNRNLVAFYAIQNKRFRINPPTSHLSVSRKQTSASSRNKTVSLLGKEQKLNWRYMYCWTLTNTSPSSQADNLSTYVTKNCFKSILDLPNNINMGSRSHGHNPCDCRKN